MPLVSGLMTFSFHLAWEHGHIDWRQILQKAVDHRLRSVEWCGPPFADPPSFDAEVIRGLRAEADRHGIRCQVSGWAPLLSEGDAVQEVDRHIETQLESTRLFGARVLRMANTWDPQWRINVPRPVPVVIANLKRIVAAAERAGVVIAFEDHLDFRIPEVRRILSEIDSPFFRLTLDTGNLLPVLEDAVTYCEAFAEKIVNVHLKGVEYIWTDAGAVLTSAPPERSIVDLRAILARLRLLPHEVTLHLEGQCMREDQEDAMLAANVAFLRAEGVA